MPDATAVATPASVVPAPNAAPKVESPAPAPPPEPAKTPPAQPPAQEPAKTSEQEAAAKRAANVERHTKLAALERQKQGRLAADRQAFELEKARLSEDLRLAGEYRRLAKIQQEDPLKYAEEVKLSVPALSKLFLEKRGGLNKTPVEVAEEAAAAVYARKEQERVAAEAKAAEAKAKLEQEAAVKAQSDAYASARKQMADIIAADKTAYRHVAALEDAGLDLAWKMTERAFVKNGNKLEGMPTFKDIVAGTEHFIRERLKAQDDADAAAKVAAEAAAKAAVPDAKQKAAAELAKGKTQDDVTTPSSKPKPTKGRLQPFMDYKAIAKQLVEEAKAKQAAAQDT